MRRIFVHLHIPKCGGSAVIDVLRRNFRSGLGNTNGILNDYQYDAEQVARIIRHYPDLRCLTGHKLSLDLPFDREGLDIQAFTFIRDPVDRFVSHYFYHRNHTNFVPEAKTMDLLGYADWALSQGNQPMYVNGQTRFLSGGSLDKVRELARGRRLLLFPSADIQGSFNALARAFPESFVDVRTAHKNVSKKDQPLPAGFRALVLPYVQDDMALLELAAQTPLVHEPPARAHGSGSRSEPSRSIALKAARFLHRAAGFIEKRC